MNPGISPGDLPPFHRLGAYVFEDMCRDLFQEEDSVATCDVFGSRGQAQYGVDLLAFRNDGEGREVGQCKCYEDFPPKKIRDASDKFFDNWSYWAAQNIKRFILFVACDLTSRQRQEEIMKQRDRFAEHGINYEAWSAPIIRNKLRPHRGIVSTYLDPREYWVNAICGPSTGSLPSPWEHAPGSSGVVNTVLANELERLGEVLEQDAQQHMEAMRVAWREGRKNEAVRWVGDLRNDQARWLALSNGVKAVLLRFSAGLELDTSGEIGQAKRLADQAKELMPSDNESRLRALIAYRESGPEAAIDLLADQLDVDSINLRAGLLLEMGRMEECRETLDFETIEFEPNALTFRARAHMYLVEKDLDQALTEINKALQIAPSWEAIKFTSAVIDYFRSMSSGALPDHVVHWPVPVPWDLVKRDDESLLRFDKAGEVFAHLAERPGASKDERQTFETWRLACLANDPERQAEAAEYCQSILEAESAHYRAITWASARNLDVDLGTSESALQEIVVRDSAQIPQILALVNLYLASQRFAEAIELLEKTAHLFEAQGTGVLWTTWYVQSLVAKGDPRAALAAIEESEFQVELAEAEALVLMNLSRESDDPGPAIQHLESSYAVTGDPVFLFEACSFMVERQEWAYVAERADLLVREVGTAEALRLAALGSYNAGRFEPCLKLLDDYRELFKNGNLPAQLRRIRAFCLKETGVVSQAAATAEALVQDEPTSENLLALAQIYFEKGYLVGLGSVGGRLLNRPDLTAEQALWMCQWVRLQNQELARSLWRKAQDLGIPDDAVGIAIFLGYQIGLDNELHQLQLRMGELGHQERGGIQIWTIDDFVSFARERGTRLANLNEIYNSGTGPVHLIAEEVRTPLADIYHGALTANEAAPNPLEQPLLLARHGGRSLAPGFPDSRPQWRLNIDITAILLAEHLGILGKVEEAFEPLRIPASLVPALVKMQDRVVSGQPSRIPTYRQILQLVEQGLLRVSDFNVPSDFDNPTLVQELGEGWVALFEASRSHTGYLVDFLPLSTVGGKDPPSSLPEGSDQRLVSCRGLVEALRQHGPLSQHQYEAALKKIGEGWPEGISRTIPEPAAVLFCHANIPEVLAEADLLRTLCSNYQVYIDKWELDRVKYGLEEHERRDALGLWISQLIARISDGLDKDTYQLIPPTPAHTQAGEGAWAKEPTDRTLLELMSFDVGDRDVVWADDRYINGFSYRDSAPIVGINEVLKGLVCANTLTVGDYYEKVSSLRAANVRFVPVEKQEILHHLKEARVDDGRIVETQALNTLRRYVSACLLRGGILQRPSAQPGSPNPNGEIAFLVGLNRAIIDSLVGIWALGEADETTKRAQSEWILENLYIDYLGICRVTSLPKTSEDERFMVAINLAGLMSQAIDFPTEQIDEMRRLRRQYFDWLYTRVLRKRIDADPTLLMSVVETLKRYLYSAQEETAKSGPPAVVSVLIQWLYEDLPEPIRSQLWRDHDFMARIGLKTQQAITVSGLNFDPEKFWTAASEVINGGEPQIIVTIDSGQRISLGPVPDGGIRDRLEFQNNADGSKGVIFDELFQILVESQDEIESVLLKNRHWFDCSDEPLRQTVVEIASIDSPRRRIDEVMSHRSNSAALHYGNLFRKFSSQDEFNFSELIPPSIDSLINHLRLTETMGSGVAFQQGLDLAAESLIREEGLVSTIDRLSGFPVALSQNIRDTVAALSKEDRRELFSKLVRTPYSPISRIHFINLLLLFAKEAPAYLKLSRKIAAELLSQEGAEEFGAFTAILRWTDEQFGSMKTANCSSHLRLALVWAHSHRLFSLLTSAGAPVSWIQQAFSATERPLSLDMFERDFDYWLDVAHPRRISWITFLFGGLSSGVDGHAIELFDQRLRDLLDSAAVSEKGGAKIPNLALYKDQSQLGNSMGSFLGGDQGEQMSQLLNFDSGNAFTRTSLQKLTEQSVARLIEAQDDFEAWASLFTIVGDSPPDEGLVEPLKSIMLQTDFVDLVNKNAQLGTLAMHTACLQVVNFGDETLRQHLKSQLVGFAQLFGQENSVEMPIPSDKSEKSSRSTTLLDLMPDLALNLSSAKVDPQNTTTEFVDIMTQLVGVWSEVGARSWLVVQRLCEELPVSHSQEFWPLLVRLRAT